MFKKSLIGVVAIAFIFTGLMFYKSSKQVAPADLGVIRDVANMKNVLKECPDKQVAPADLGVIRDVANMKNVLKECPDKPNCVISFKEGSKRDGQYLEAFQGSGDKNHDYQRILKILEKTSNVKIVKKTDDYIHAEFTSSIFRFVDDVEFYFGEDKKVHFRSASRVGYSDLGANKKRIEKIRFEFQQS